MPWQINMSTFNFSRSRLESYNLFHHHFFIKRDDKIHKFCNGNKARKFNALLAPQYAKNEWISYGGNQSNAMSVLAYLAKKQKSVLHYIMPSFTPHSASVGNLKVALKLGMQAHIMPMQSSVESLKNAALQLAYHKPQALFIPQGGSVELAMKGMESLALELKNQYESKQSQNNHTFPIIFYTSGSGVSVVALQLALDKIMPYAKLVALNCAGNIDSLQKQFAHYHTSCFKILHSPFRFAMPKKEIWEMNTYLAHAGLECDLIYDSVGFILIKKNLHNFHKHDLIFIHSGGLLGNSSQILRYKKIGLANSWQ